MRLGLSCGSKKQTPLPFISVFSVIPSSSTTPATSNTPSRSPISMDGEGSGVPEIRYRDEDEGEDDGVTRTGTLATCVFHIITTNIGSGVLSLAWSTAQLGWVWGPASMAFFAFVTYVSSFLLSDCYRSPDSDTGKRNKTYMDAVRVNLGTI